MKRTLLTLLGLLCLLLNIDAQERVRPYSISDLSAKDRSAAGITVSGGISPEKLIKDVLIGGNCFTIKNVKYTGDSACIGKFTGGKKGINVENGVIMTTGNIKTAEPPNNKSDYSFANPDISEDSDLKQLINGVEEIHDQAILEFDFTPTANTIQFKFVFASEEYCEYVNSKYNDVFGFFISGPGINGTFQNKAKNIALIPNTSTFVSINNVNHQSYSNYFVNNIHQLNPAIACLGIGSKGKFLDQVAYDGFTKVLTATATVEPCQVYHIKLAIADVKDHSFDSAVFLAANSFNSGGNATAEANIPQSIGADKETVYEGCDSTAITFKRLDDDDSQPVTIKFNVDNSSTATEGLDYEMLPKSITIPAGQSIYRLPIKVINDKITEADEKIVLKIETTCTCEETKVSLKIRDVPDFALSVRDTAFCGNLPVTLASSVKGGIGKVSYAWSNGFTSPSITVQPGVSAKFNLTVTDACGVAINDEVQVTIAQPPIATLASPDFEVCRIGQKAKIPIQLDGVPPFTLSYLLNGNTTTQTITQAQTFITIDTIGFIQLKKVNTGSCVGKVSGSTSIVLKPIELFAIPTDLKCYNVQNGSIDLKISGGGSAPYTYNWSNGGSVEDPSALGAGTYQVTVTDPNLCKATYEVKIKEPKELLPQVVKTSTVNCDNLKNGILEVAASGGIAPYTYTWSNGLQGATLDNLVSGVYQFTVTDKNGCSRNDEAQVKTDTVKPKTLVVDAVSPSCRSQFGAIYIKSTNGGAAPYSYRLDSTFAGNKIFQKLLPNTYVLTVRGSNGCTNSWDVKVPTYEEPEVSLTPLDTLILPGDSVTLSATHNLTTAQLKSITWEPDVQLSCQGCIETTVKPFTATVYTVKVKDKFDCEATASARIRFNRKVEIYVPNMLNTASDYVQNRKLGVYGNLRQVKNINLFIVHDRWGTEVYRSTEMRLNDQREGWDGLYKNQEVVPGTYVYFTEIELYNGEILRKSGDVTVIK